MTIFMKLVGGISHCECGRCWPLYGPVARMAFVCKLAAVATRARMELREAEDESATYLTCVFSPGMQVCTPSRTSVTALQGILVLTCRPASMSVHPSTRFPQTNWRRSTAGLLDEIASRTSGCCEHKRRYGDEAHVEQKRGPGGKRLRVRFDVSEQRISVQSTAPQDVGQHIVREIPDLSCPAPMLCHDDINGMHHYIEWQGDFAGAIYTCVQEHEGTMDDIRPCWSRIENIPGSSYQDLPRTLEAHSDEELNLENCNELLQCYERASSPETSSSTASSTDSDSLWDTASEFGSDTDASSVGSEFVDCTEMDIEVA